MIAEWAVELCVQWLNGFPFGWSLSLAFPLSHDTKFSRNRKIVLVRSIILILAGNTSLP